MRWPRRIALTAGLALIAVTDVVVLAGVAYNRAGEPESALTLTQRELRPPYVWVGRKENSGLALQLRWRVVPGTVPNAGIYRFDSEGGGAPAWLDAQKMASLGFDTRASAVSPGVGRDSPYQRQLPRDVLVVLELDGPAYQEALERAAQAAREVESTNRRGEGKKDAQAIIDREARLSSRLFAVDAGLDRGALRSRYPDRTKYAIVRGQVRPAWLRGDKAGSGVIDGLSAASVNVPLEMRGAFEGVAPVDYGRPNDDGRHFEARLAFGRRLEPWLVSATGK